MRSSKNISKKKKNERTVKHGQCAYTFHCNWNGCKKKSFTAASWSCLYVSPSQNNYIQYARDMLVINSDCLSACTSRNQYFSNVLSMWVYLISHTKFPEILLNSVQKVMVKITYPWLCWWVYFGVYWWWSVDDIKYIYSYELPANYTVKLFTSLKRHNWSKHCGLRFVALSLLTLQLLKHGICVFSCQHCVGLDFFQ